ncbi:hypothetical protein GCM10023205_44400 [Yinghuangia aomiensis]|uniref:Uncharacterized protein n=1 Tax=Yinghuangia aomiensis TaxID=676205 RepID=A0ABP9HKN1_9ACTN
MGRARAQSEAAAPELSPRRGTARRSDAGASASKRARRGLPRLLVAVALAAFALLTLAHGLACAPHGASGGSDHTSVLANPASAALPIAPHAAPRGTAHVDPRPAPARHGGFFADAPLPDAAVPRDALAPDVFPPGRAVPDTGADGPWSVTAAADHTRTPDDGTRVGDLGTDRTTDSDADRALNPRTADRAQARTGSPYVPPTNTIRVAAAVAGVAAHSAAPAHLADTPAAATPDGPAEGTGEPTELPCDTPAGCARQAVPNTAAPPLGGASPLLPPPVAADPSGDPGPLAPLARQRCVKRALPGHRPVLDLVCVSRT